MSQRVLTRSTRLLVPVAMLLIFGAASGAELAQQPSGLVAALAAPDWVQNFDVTGSESASFGFAVTKPGPIQLDVSWQGPPLRIELRGSNRSRQTGVGHVEMRYDVTSNDLQHGPLWNVLVSLQNPSGETATGTIKLQRPPVDAALLRSQLQSNDARRASGRPPPPTPASPAAAVASDALRSRLERIDRELAAHHADARRQFEAARDGQISSRAIRRDTGVMAEPRQAILSQAVQQSAAAAEAPAQTRPLAPPAQVAPPTVTGLAPSAGQPGDPVLITGSDFGTARGEVHFVVNPGKDVIAPIDSWGDSRIEVKVPSARCALAALATVYVVAHGTNSAGARFQFTPTLGARTYVLTWSAPGTAVKRPGVMQPIGSVTYIRPFGEIPGQGVIWHQNNDPFIGHKDTDVFFQGVALNNGWALEDVVLGLIRKSGGDADAYVTSFAKGSPWPVINVHWWTNLFNPFIEWSGPEVVYALAAIVKGPADMPDGLASGTPCKE